MLRSVHSATRAVAGAVALVVLLPAVASAGQRHTTPTASATSGACTAALPCRIDHAINAAIAGDEVIVASGTYRVQRLLDAPVIDLHGVAGQARPLLVGDSTLKAALLSFKEGGTLRHLALRGTASNQDALVLQKGLAEDLTIASAAGDGAKVVGDPSKTVLRDSVVRTDSAVSGGAALKLRDSGGGDLALRNVTAIAPSGIAVRCEVSKGEATLVNVLARGGVADVEATNGGQGCIASHSSLRPERSPGLALGAGIQSADPRFADAAGGNYRPLPDSPTVDAGTSDPLLGAADPDGLARNTGGGPDIGAFECCGSAAWPEPEKVFADPLPTDVTQPAPIRDFEKLPQDLRGIPAPVLGSTVILAPSRGRIHVRRPGGRRFRRLRAAARLPVGTVVDATRGRLRLVSALDGAGRVQTARLWGGRFQVRQGRAQRGMTSLALRGGSFRACPRSRAATISRVPPENGTTRRVVRSLWVRDHNGRFRSYGNNSVATARGTAWVTEDRCDGTVTRVIEGSMAVRARGGRKTVVVRAGRSHLTPKR